MLYMTCAPDEYEVLSVSDLVAALRDASPSAEIQEQEPGWFIVDGRFDLRAVAHALSQRSRRSRVLPRSNGERGDE